MSYTRIDANYTWRGFRAVILENRYLRAMFLPELGGKMWSLYDKIADCEVLWHNPRLPPRPAHYGAAYDDWFCGGWDELFPNDAPTMLSGEPYPDHGEWWAMPFDVDIIQTDNHCGIVLRRRGVVTDTAVVKTITLHNDESQLRIQYQLTNHSYQPLDYLWKLHPALAITPDCRIDMPAQRVIVEEGFRGRIGADVAQFTWPHAGAIDMRQIPPVTAQSCDFYYGLDLQAGWCALTDTRLRRGFGLAFDAELFRSCGCLVPTVAGAGCIPLSSSPVLVILTGLMMRWRKGRLVAWHRGRNSAPNYAWCCISKPVASHRLVAMAR